ncbi:MAG: desulfoferrodoxin [Chloroflexi bacterium]|nr:desulfoferrodoxin [Chloroflexota bacterium]
MNETGKRYSCTKCGSEILVTRGGEGTLLCCGQPMVKKT